MRSILIATVLFASTAMSAAAHAAPACIHGGTKLALFPASANHNAGNQMLVGDIYAINCRTASDGQACIDKMLADAHQRGKLLKVERVEVIKAEPRC